MAKAKKNSKGNIEEMKSGELEKNLASLREEIRLIKFKAEGARSKNVKEISNLKKKIARILTQISKQK